ncbi:MAG: NAD(P)H-dependent oxidoreductase [Opitutales bacterium]
MASSVLILFAHPAYERSRAQRALLKGLQGLEGVQVHDLYEAYPDFAIDVPREQKLLEAHATVIFQFPMFWYSTPAILKEWQDLVLEHGWAYGTGGNALQGKRFVCATSTGGGLQSYTATGGNRHTIAQLLRPLEQTAYLCGMQPQEPFVVYGTHNLTDAELKEAAARYRALLEGWSGA